MIQRSARTDDLTGQPSPYELARRVCADFRTWAPQLGEAPRIEPVKESGKSNWTFRLRSPGCSWALRVNRKPDPTGVNREREINLHNLAARHGIAPPVVLSDPEAGFLLTEWISTPTFPSSAKLDGTFDGDGQSISANPLYLSRFLRTLHAIPLPASLAQSPLQVVRRLNTFRSMLPSDSLARLASHAQDEQLLHAESLLAEGTFTPVFCHNDLNPTNLLAISPADEKEPCHLLALDWEYACAGDALFDLAVAGTTLADSNADELLEAYLQRTPSVLEEQRYRSTAVLVTTLELFWFELYGSSEDFQVCLNRYPERIKRWAASR